MAYRYKTVKRGGKTVLLHRWLWAQAHGTIPPGGVIHHRNGDRYDNRLENLELTRAQPHSAHHNQRHPLVKECEVCGRSYTPEARHRKRAGRWG